MRKFILLLPFMAGMIHGHAQSVTKLSADAWVDSVFKTLSPDEKIAQLMVVRGSGLDATTHRPVFYDQQLEEAVHKYNVGGICMFQGDPLSQADHINHY